MDSLPDGSTPPDRTPASGGRPPCRHERLDDGGGPVGVGAEGVRRAGDDDQYGERAGREDSLDLVVLDARHRGVREHRSRRRRVAVAEHARQVADGEYAQGQRKAAPGYTPCCRCGQASSCRPVSAVGWAAWGCPVEVGGVRLGRCAGIGCLRGVDLVTEVFAGLLFELVLGWGEALADALFVLQLVEVFAGAVGGAEVGDGLVGCRRRLAGQ
ncbi:MAG: hypothetical protein ACJ73S_27890 [Mycobacteriales bacterium]